MKQYFLCIVFFTASVFSQTGGQSDFAGYISPPPVNPFNPKGDQNTYAIKAKAAPFFIGNGFAAYNSLGIEIGFLKNHSVALDGFYNFSRDIEDFVTDRQGVEHESGNRSYLNERALLLSYRYYYNFEKWRKDWRLAFYNGLFFRKEQDVSTNDENYVNDYIKKTTNKKAFGIQLGMIQRFRNSRHFGMDYNISFGKQFNQIKKYKLADTSYITEYSKDDSLYFNVGVSVNYWF